MARKKKRNIKKRSLPKGTSKIRVVMREFKKGRLKIGKSEKEVTSRKQAIAIGLHEQGRADKS